MAIGLISIPALWKAGTTVASTWLQNVQDNINGLIGGSQYVGGIAIDANNPGTTAAGSGKGHILVNGSYASISYGTGAGTSPTTTFFGNDCMGQITITAGTSPQVNQKLFAVTFANSYPQSVSVLLQPANQATATLSGASVPYISSQGLTSFQINSGSTALVATTGYAWNYFVIGF